MHFTDLSINEIDNHEFQDLVMEILRPKSLVDDSTMGSNKFQLNLEVLEHSPLLASLKSTFDFRANNERFFQEIENVINCLKTQGDLFLKEINAVVQAYRVNDGEFNQVEKTEFIRQKENSLRGLRYLTKTVLSKIIQEFSLEELEPFTKLISPKSNFSLDYLDLLTEARKVPFNLQNQLIQEIANNTELKHLYVEKCLRLISVSETIDFAQAKVVVAKLCCVPLNTILYKKGILCLKELCERSLINSEFIKQALESHNEQESQQLIVLKLELSDSANLDKFNKNEIDHLLNKSSILLDRYIIRYLDNNQELGVLLIPRLSFFAENFSHPYIREAYQLMVKLGKQDTSVLNIVENLLSEVKKYNLEDLHKKPLNPLNVNSDFPAGVTVLSNSSEDLQLECLIIALGLMADSNPRLLSEYRNLLKFNNPKLNTLILKNLNLGEVQKPQVLFQFINELLLVNSSDTYPFIERQLCALRQADFIAFVEQSQECFKQLKLVYSDDPQSSIKIQKIIEFIQSLHK